MGSVARKRTPFKTVQELATEELFALQGDRSATTVQFAFYNALTERGFKVAPEYSLPSRHHRSGLFRADLAIIDGENRPVALIECKGDEEYEVTGPQKRAYDECGIPWILGTRFDHPAVFDWVEQFPKCGVL